MNAHLFPVDFGIQGSFGQQHGVLFWRYTELVVERVMPDLLHVVPVGDDAVLDGILEGQDTTFRLRFVSASRARGIRGRSGVLAE